jgi:hypothetical protein
LGSNPRSARPFPTESGVVLGAAVDDAKNFLDMERTGLIIVDERTILG